jgi:DNA-binding FadR family transcriptional regulator
MDHEIDADPRFDLLRDSGRPLPDVLADKVTELIESEVYRPGRRLHSEADLTRRWKVARSSLRTALQRLETRGVLESKHGRGWFVRRAQPPDQTSLSELFSGRRYGISDLLEMRIGLEGLAVSLAAVRATDGEVEDIAKFNRQHFEADDDQDELLRTDQAFHEAIVASARNALLVLSYQQIVTEIVELRYESFAVRGVPLRSAREHEKIVRYLRNRDPGGARVAMNSHLQRLYDELADIHHEPLDLTQSRPDAEPDWRLRGTRQ